MSQAAISQAMMTNADRSGSGPRRVERLLGDRFRIVWFGGGRSVLPDQQARVKLVRLTRPTGALTLSRSEHDALLETFAWWAELRLRWHVYEEPKWREPDARPARYAAPGHAYTRSLATNELFAREERSLPEEPVSIAPGVERIATLWHPEERIGPHGGAEVGAELRLSESLHAWALAASLWIVRAPFAAPRERLRIDAGEEALLANAEKPPLSPCSARLPSEARRTPPTEEISDRAVWPQHAPKR